jgi:hypothetical protein
VGGGKIRLSSRSIPLALLLLCLASFGLLAWRLGFYWDDWPTIWYLHNFGPSSFRQGFATDRPLLAYVFMFTTSLLGESAAAWQYFGILSRWICALCFWWALRLTWPERPLVTTWAAIFFAIYPGFRQGYISVTYSNGFLVYSLYILSFVGMLLALRRRRGAWVLNLASAVLASLTLFISEYFFGLELLRPVLLWVFERRGEPSTARLSRRVALSWLPYLIGAGLFLYWRLVLHITPRGNVVLFSLLQAHPFQTLLGLAGTIFQDLFEVTLLSWIKTLILPRLADIGLLYLLGYLGVTLGVAGLCVFYLWRLQGNAALPAPLPPASREGKKWSFRLSLDMPFLKIILAGLFTLLVAGWPIWTTDLHFDLVFPWDRFTLMMMPGASILLTGIIGLVARSPRRRGVLVGALVGLAAGMHYYDAVGYRAEWLSQKAFFWQLTWRIPGLERGTALLTADLPFIYYSDNSLSAPLNWTYDPGNTSHQMSYLVYDVESRLYKDLPSLDPGLPIDMPYRVTNFQGSTSQAVLFFYTPPRCLKVMHPLEDSNLPYKPLLIPETLPLSRPELIVTGADSPASPPFKIFGPEPQPDWCYYFENAELASQSGDWATVVALSEPALGLKKEFDRETASELMPFIKGFAYTGVWDRAVELSKQAIGASPKMQNMLCQAWYLMRDRTPAGDSKDVAYSQVAKEIPCSFP